jgi:hypothetical protein
MPFTLHDSRATSLVKGGDDMGSWDAGHKEEKGPALVTTNDSRLTVEGKTMS